MPTVRACLAMLPFLLGTAQAASPAPPPLRIGVTGAFTGNSSPMGLSMRAGIRLATEEINSQGGIGGRMLQLVERDDASQNERGIRIAHEFTSKQKLDAVIGFVNTPVVLASIGIYQQARMPVMVTIATAPEILQRHQQAPVHYIFRVSAPDDTQAELIVQEAVRRDGLRRVAIFADTTPYGRNGQAQLLKALARRGLKPVNIENFGQNERDLNLALMRSREAGAETLLTYGIGSPLAAIANGMKKMGWHVPIMGSWTLSMSNFIDQAGPNAEGTRMVQTFIENSHEIRQQAFAKRFYQRFHTKRMRSPSAVAQGYDGMLLLAQGLRESQGEGGVKLVQALEGLRNPVEGVIARYERPYSRHDHEAIDDSVPLIGIVRIGRVTFAHPQDRMRALPKPAPAMP